MQVVVDTSVLVAVILSETERPALLAATQGVDLVAPGSVHWEVGNALAALFKRRRLNLSQATVAIDAYEQIPLRLIDVDVSASLHVAAELGLYAYDAYVLTCARMQRAPLLTLDKELARAAHRAGVRLQEV